MAEPGARERLQPSLLDRLTDDNPRAREESRERRVISMNRLRECVLRDLGWLLNSASLSTDQDLENYPEVARSVLNYGIPDLAGHTASSIEVPALEKVMRQVIWDFEPRLLRRSVKVRLEKSTDDSPQNAMVFHIEAQLWADPVPVQLYLKTEVDFEDGHVTVNEEGQG